MSIMTQKKLLTAEEFYRLPQPSDGSEQELVRGEIVIMPPPGGRHGVVCLNVSILVGGFIKQKKLGPAMSNDTGVILGRDPDTVRGADFAYWSRERLPVVPVGYPDIAPDLAVEVMSPSDVPSKVEQKVLHYLRSGVQQVWVLDPNDRTIAIHKAAEDAVTLEQTETVTGGDVLPGFACLVAEFFS